MIYWCLMAEDFVEIVWREDGMPICFWPEPAKRSSSGWANVCNEDDDNFVELSDCELTCLFRGIAEMEIVE